MLKTVVILVENSSSAKSDQNGRRLSYHAHFKKAAGSGGTAIDVGKGPPFIWGSGALP